MFQVAINKMQKQYLQDFNRKDYYMKTCLKNITLVFFTMAIFVGCQSYEKKMEKYAQRAVEYKKTLPKDVDIICEVIDSNATKIYYKEKDSAYIVVYDLATKSESIIKIEEGELAYMYYGYRTQLYKDRLFIIAETGACGGGLDHAKNVSYINVRDNSVHHVIECYEANFLQDRISIERAFPIDDSRPTFELEWMYDEYSLSAYLSDEEYALSEIKQNGKEEEMARAERNKPKEKRIYAWFVIDGKGFPITHKSEGIDEIWKLRDRVDRHFGTPIIKVPENKIWEIKKIKTYNMDTPHIRCDGSRSDIRWEGYPIEIIGGREFAIVIDVPYGKYGDENHPCVLDVTIMERNKY